MIPKLLSFAFWVYLYYSCVTKWKDKSPEFGSRAVTLLHGVVATLAGSYLCGEPSFERCTMKITSAHHALMIWSWGYFTFDFFWCFYYWPKNYLMLVHHLSALIGISMYMQKPYSGCIFPCGMALMEVTNPLLQMRWFLRSHGYDNNIFFTIIEAVYLASFIAVRGIIGTYLMIKILDSDTFDKDEKIISFVLYLVSIGLINEIVGFVLYKYKTKIVLVYCIPLQASSCCPPLENSCSPGTSEIHVRLVRRKYQANMNFQEEDSTLEGDTINKTNFKDSLLKWVMY